MIYQWKNGFPNRRVRAEDAARQLERLRRTHHDLTPDLIVEDSKRPDAPLNPVFEWNNAEAARLYRLEVAGHVLQALVYIEEGSDKPPIRAFVHIAADGERGSRYESIRVVMASPDLRTQVVEAAWRELQGWRKRYQEYKEFAGLLAVIEQTPEPWSKAS